MNELYLTDEDVHALDEPTWEERKISNLKKKLSHAEDKLDAIKIKIDLDINVNKRCLQEKNISYDAKFLFEQSLKFDNEILEILSDN